MKMPNPDPYSQLARAASMMALPPGSALAWERVVPVEHVSLSGHLHDMAPRRRASFAAGRIAARTALEAAGYVDPAPLQRRQNGLAQWPSGWLGSITHTDEVAASVVMPAGGCIGVGIDLEPVMPSATANEIAAEIMPEATPGHFGMVTQVELTRVFSAKEALYKALFPLTGAFREFSAARIEWRVAEDGGLPLASLRLAEDWGRDWSKGRVVDVHQAIAGGCVLSFVWC